MLSRGSLSLVCLGLLGSGAATAQQYTITTFAGNGTAGYVDGADLAAAQFTSPNAIAIDSKGAIYIADTGGQRIRQISGNSVSTIAGTGTAGYSATDTSATSAALNGPGAIAVDSSGSVYIAESSNNIVRKITGGSISLFAGSPDGVAGNDGDGANANSAHLTGPAGLAVDADGNVYISDTGNGLIRRVTKDGIVHNWVGAGYTDRALQNPTGLCLDSAGTLYIVDTGHQRVAKYINGAKPNLETVAGIGTVGFSGDGGPATRAQLNNPIGCAIDAAGNLYIADANNGRIRRVTPDGRIYTIAGRGGAGYSGDDGVATSAQLNFPRGVALGPDGKIYIADTLNNRIRTLSGTSGTIDGVVNAASFTAGISPGALASIFGSNFGTTTAQGDIGLITNALPTTLNNIGVTVNGTPSPLLYLSPGQINFQVPWGTQTGTADVAVTINGGPSNILQVPVQSAAPGLFTLETGAAIVQNADYTLNDADHPAAPGGTIIAYLTGSGPVDPAVADGTPTPLSPLTYITSSKSAKIGSADAQISFAGLSPNFVGLVQVNVVVPTGLASGTHPLTITIDGQASNAGNIVVK